MFEESRNTKYNSPMFRARVTAGHNKGSHMMGDWTFFSNHGHVLVCLARDGRARLRDVAQDVGITERAVQKIVKDLQEAGFITVRKQGRCNRYRINRRKALRHGLESHCTVGKLLALVATGGKAAVRFEEVEEEPVADPVPESEPAAQAEDTAELPPVTEPEPEPESKPKTNKEKSPADAEQQGSLF